MLFKILLPVTLTQSYISLIYLRTFILIAAFLGDIALDEDDLRLFKGARGGDDAQHAVQSNHTNSGVKTEKTQLIC